MAALLVSFLLSFLPAFFYASFMYWLDRYEKEPRLLLGGVFLWGAVFAMVAALVAEVVFGAGLAALTGSQALSDLIGTSLVAPIIEESVKGLAVLFVFAALRREFDSILDGMIYAGVTALGFAATENTGYLFARGYLEEGWAGLAVLFVLRVLLGGWDHPFYTAFTGIGLAIARLSPNPTLKIVAPVAGWGAAIAMHALKNSLISFLGGVGLIVGLLVNWSGWVLMFFFIILLLLRERALLIRQLVDEVQSGRITPAQYQTAISLWRPTAATFAGLGSGRFRASSRFYQVCGELAHKKDQLARFGNESGNMLAVERLRSELVRLSPVAATA